MNNLRMLVMGHVQTPRNLKTAVSIRNQQTARVANVFSENRVSCCLMNRLMQPRVGLAIALDILSLCSLPTFCECLSHDSHISLPDPLCCKARHGHLELTNCLQCTGQLRHAGLANINTGTRGDRHQTARRECNQGLSDGCT